MAKKKKVKKDSMNTRIKRLHSLNEEEVRAYHDITKKSAHVFKDRSKFDKKRSRQEKQKGWN